MNKEEKTSVDLQTVAVIAAAIAAVLDKPHRVLSVKRVVVPAPHMNVWAFEGRVELSMSHRLR
jgi:hypothetical protein